MSSEDAPSPENITPQEEETEQQDSTSYPENIQQAEAMIEQAINQINQQFFGEVPPSMTVHATEMTHPGPIFGTVILGDNNIPHGMDVQLPPDKQIGNVSYDRIETANGTLDRIRIRVKQTVGVGQEIHMIHNRHSGSNTYSVDEKIISCEEMADLVDSISPALECLPLSIVEGPFKELDEHLRRDHSIQEKQHNRFNDLELEDEQDSRGNSKPTDEGD